jgi:hypothetical protein
MIVRIPGIVCVCNFIFVLVISLFEIRGSHSGTAEDSILMVCYSMSLGKYVIPNVAKVRSAFTFRVK